MHALPRLIARLPPNYSRIEEFENQLYRIKAGYTGELIVDRYLDSLELPTTSTILTNLHLFTTPDHSFQIDTLLVSENFIVLLEVKYMVGELRFMSAPDQLEQTHPSGKVTIMDCPIVQLENARYYLQSWLAKRGIQVAVSGQIVLANKRSKVRLAPSNAPIVYLNRLRIFLEEKERGQAIHSSAEIKKISELLQKSQKSYNPYPLCEYYRIDPKLLKKGQLCSMCNAVMVYKNHKQRQCSVCPKVEANNYRQTITDWFMLVGDSISNRECRDFLQLKNKDDANYALNILRLNKKGKSVATRYHWPKGEAFTDKKSLR